MRSFSILEPAEAPLYRSLAFPRHRPLLLHDLGASGTTVAAGASLLGMPCGLGLAGPLGGEVVALHSVVVAPQVRRRGIAARLLQELEAGLCARGARRLVGSHRGDQPDSEAVSRLFVRCGFERVRSVIEIVYRVAVVVQAPVLNVSCRGAEVMDFTPERLAPLLELREPSGLVPASFGPRASDPDLSLLVAFEGRVAACVLVRRAGPDLAYFSLLFVRPELRRRTRLAAFAVRQLLGRLTERGLGRLACEISVDNVASLAFADEGLGRYAEFRAVVHTVSKSLDESGRA